MVETTQISAMVILSLLPERIVGPVLQLSSNNLVYHIHADGCTFQFN